MHSGCRINNQSKRHGQQLAIRLAFIVPPLKRNDWIGKTPETGEGGGAHFPERPLPFSLGLFGV